MTQKQSKRQGRRSKCLNISGNISSTLSAARPVLGWGSDLTPYDRDIRIWNRVVTRGTRRSGRESQRELLAAIIEKK